MGESRGGEGAAQGAATVDVARAIARECSNSGILVGSVTVRYVTAGVYAVEVQEHGSPESEAFFVSLSEDDIDVRPS